MSKYDKLKSAFTNVADWFSKQDSQKGYLPKPANPNDLSIGKTMIMDDGTPLEVKRVTGNIANPKSFEVNGTHLIGMLSFYTQVYENRLLTPEERQGWDSIELLAIEPAAKKSLKELTNEKKDIL